MQRLPAGSMEEGRVSMKEITNTITGLLLFPKACRHGRGSSAQEVVCWVAPLGVRRAEKEDLRFQIYDFRSKNKPGGKSLIKVAIETIRLN